jgi:general stress protein YciG
MIARTRSTGPEGERDGHGRFVKGTAAAREAGSSGGKLSSGSFQKGSDRAREAGRKGGKESTRRPVKPKDASDLRRPRTRKREPSPYVKTSADTATQILRGMVLSLLDNGFKKQDVATALDRLAGEATSGDWQKPLESRKRARGLGR